MSAVRTTVSECVGGRTYLSQMQVIGSLAKRLTASMIADAFASVWRGCRSDGARGQEQTTLRSASLEGRDCGLERIVIHETNGRSPSRVASRVMNVMRTKHSQGDRNGAASAINRSPLPRSGSTRRRSDASPNPQESFERYVMLARAAAASGDTIETERHFQHAEHYFRLMNKSIA